ncbi:retrotransposon protein, putative, ty1-copia subclass [Tanacetum coccineum]
MSKLAFCDYHNMVAILEKTEHNTDFHLIVDFLEASPLRHYQKSHSTPSHTPTPRRLTKRAIRIAQSKALTPGADEPASPPRDDSHGEAFPTATSLDAGQDRENIPKTSAMPHESSPRVTSLGGDEGRSRLWRMLKRLEEMFKRMLQTGGDDGSRGAFCIERDGNKKQLKVELVEKDTNIAGCNHYNTAVNNHIQEGTRSSRGLLYTSSSPIPYHNIPSITEDVLSLEDKIELITELAKYQKDLAQIKKYQITSKQKLQGTTLSKIRRRLQSSFGNLQDFGPIDSKLEMKDSRGQCTLIEKRKEQRYMKTVEVLQKQQTEGNKEFVARYAEFFEKNLITQEVNGRARDLKEIQDEDTSPFKITSKIPMEVEGFEPPQEEDIPIRRSERTHRAPNHLSLNVEMEEHSLGDLNEPANYKAAMLDPESNKWIDAMNAEIQSMMDNVVWVLVDLPPGCKTVGSKWFFEKKIDMDGIVHTCFVDPNHSRKVCKLQRSIYGLKQASRSWNKRFDEEIKRFGFTQNLDEPCVYQKASGSNVTFLILDRSKRLIGLGQNDYMDKILKRYKMDNSKRGHIPMQERLDLNKTQGASTPKEVKRMQNVLYASAVGSIMYAVRCTRPDIAFAGNPEAELQVDCYCNTGFEIDIDDMKSLTGYISLGIVPTINELIKMFCDDSAALLIANEPGVQMGARHYHRSNLLKVHTDDNLAYPFTKALSNTKLTQHARSMGLRLASSFM